MTDTPSGPISRVVGFHRTIDVDQGMLSTKVPGRQWRVDTLTRIHVDNYQVGRDVRLTFSAVNDSVREFQANLSRADAIALHAYLGEAIEASAP